MYRKKATYKTQSHELNTLLKAKAPYMVPD